MSKSISIQKFKIGFFIALLAGTFFAGSLLNPAPAAALTSCPTDITEPTFNPYPVTWANDAGCIGGVSADFAVISGNVHGAGFWAPSFNAQVGDSITLRIYVHNGASSDSGAVMHNVRYNTAMSDSQDGSSHTLTTTLMADNAVNSGKQGSVTINTPAGSTLQVTSGNLDGFVGDMQPCFEYSQAYYVTMTVVASNPPAVNHPPVLTLNGNNPLNLTQGTQWFDPGATAIDQEDGNISHLISVAGTVNTSAVGSYTIVYNVTDSGGLTTSVPRTVNVTPSYNATLSLNGTNFKVGDQWTLSISSNIPNANFNLCGTNSTTGIPSCSPNFGVTDGYGNWTQSGTFPSSDIGSWVQRVEFPAQGVSSNQISWTLSAAVVNHPPVITLNGSNPMSLTAGTQWFDPGATAIDQEDGNISHLISVAGTVNTSAVGSYTIVYNVTDSGGLTSSVSRVVNITAAPVSNTATLSINKTNFIVGEQWTLNVGSNMPNSSFNVCAVHPNGVRDCTPAGSLGGSTIGSTNASGSWALSGTFTSADLGSWDEWVCFGTVTNCNNQTAGVNSNHINFTVSPAPVTNHPPVLTLLGANPMTITAGQTFVDPGATATDQEEGNITSRIVVSGSVNTAVVGTYTVMYTVSDTQGATATAWRTVNVVPGTLVCIAPQFTSPLTASAIAGQIFNYTITASSTGINAFSISGTLPAGLSFTQSIGVLNGTFATAGTYTIPLAVVSTCTGAGTTATSATTTANLVVTVSPVPQVPSATLLINNQATGAFSVGQQWTLTLTSNLPDTAFNICAVHPDGVRDCTPAGSLAGSVVGRTTATGAWNLSGTFTTADIGNWDEWACFGTVTNCNNQTGGVVMSSHIVFSVSPVVNINHAPVITVLGSNPLTITRGTTYVDAGATAFDQEDGNITSRIVTTNNVNSNVAGTYNVTYTVTDTQGASATAVRVVNVIAPQTSVCLAPQFTSVLNASGVVGQPFTYLLTASSTGSNVFSIPASAIPGGLTFSTNTISGTPTTAGTFTIPMTVTTTCVGSNAGTASTTANLVVTITNPTAPMCLVPTAGIQTQLSIGTGFGNDKPLQSILNDAGYINIVTAEQKNYQTWNTSNSSTTIEVEFLDHTAAAGNVFGYYVNGDVNTFIPLFKAGSGTNTRYPNVPTIAKGQKVSFTVRNVQNVEFAIQNQSSTGQNNLISTESSKNNGEIHVLSFDARTNGGSVVGDYLLGFEDINPLASADRDFNDVVVRVHVVNCGAATANHAPVITVLGANPATVTVNTTYTDPGATAFDQEDGNITSRIVASSTVNTNIVGTYAVTYTVSDLQGATASATRTVNVVPANVCSAATFTSSLTASGIVGQSFSYILTASSTGSNIFSIASSSLPGGLKFATNTISGTPTTAGTFTVPLTVVTTCTGSTTGTATTTANLVITITNPGGGGGNTNVCLAPQFTSSLTASGIVGQAFSYTLTASSTGSNVFSVATSSLPGGLAFSTNTISGTPTTSGTFTIPMTVVVTCTGTAGTATTTSNLILTITNPGGGGGTTPNVNLGVTKTADRTTVSVGENITYTITVTNSGTDNATGVVVTDVLPSTLTFVSATSAIGSYSTTTSQWQIGNLAHGSSTTLTLVARVNAGSEGRTITNSASASATQNDTNTGDNTGSVNVTVNSPGGGGCTGNCGGGNAPTPPGGGGGGPITPNNLTIFNEQVVETVPGVAFVSWNTNLPATRRVVYDTVSHATLGTDTNYGYPNSTELIGSPLLTAHGMAVSIQPNKTYYFRAISTDGTHTPAVSKELVLNTGTTGGGTTGGSCYYLYDYLRKDFNNNPNEVKKLQIFLRDLEGFRNLQVTGEYDDATVDAVNAFQMRYSGDILTPWGYEPTTPTGYTYILTKKKVNEIYCHMAFPVNAQQQAEIDAFRAFMESLKNAGVDLTPPATTTPGTTTPPIDNGVIGQGPTGTSTVGGLIPPGNVASRLVANVLAAGGSLAAAITGLFKSAAGLLTLLLIILILIVAYLWYREHQKNKSLEEANKQVDLK